MQRLFIKVIISTSSNEYNRLCNLVSSFRFLFQKFYRVLKSYKGRGRVCGICNVKESNLQSLTPHWHPSQVPHVIKLINSVSSYSLSKTICGPFVSHTLDTQKWSRCFVLQYKSYVLYFRNKLWYIPVFKKAVNVPGLILSFPIYRFMTKTHILNLIKGFYHI